MFNRNSSISLKRRRNTINLEQINLQSCAFIAMVVMVLIISILCVAACPNSNIPSNF